MQKKPASRKECQVRWLRIFGCCDLSMQAARLRVPQQFDLTFVISGFLTSDWNTENG